LAVAGFLFNPQLIPLYRNLLEPQMIMQPVKRFLCQRTEAGRARTDCSLVGGKVAGAWSWPLTSIWCRGQRMRGSIPPLLHTYSWRGL